MSWLSSAGNFITDELLGVDDFQSAYSHARKGEWGAAAKSVGTGAFELGTTVATPFTGGASLAAKGAVMSGKAAHLATAGRAAEGAIEATRAVRGAETVTSVSRPSVQAYAEGSGREFLASSFDIGRTSAGSGRTMSRAADQTAYGFPDSVAAGRSPVATLTRPGVKPVTPEGPVWNPSREPFRPTPPPGKPQPKFDPITPQKPTRKPVREPDINPERVPVETPTVPDTVNPVNPGPGTTLMPKDKLITEEGVVTETQLQPKLGPNGRPLPVGVVAPAAGTEGPNGTPTKPGTKPKKPRKYKNDSVWLQVPGQDVTQQVVY
jgi:hypothetical protein